MSSPITAEGMRAEAADTEAREATCIFTPPCRKCALGSKRAAMLRAGADAIEREEQRRKSGAVICSASYIAQVDKDRSELLRLRASDIHVLPLNDLHPHVETRECWCVPTSKATWDGHALVVIHNSADLREKTKQ